MSKKLSEMNTLETMDTLALITPELGTILKDENVVKIFQSSGITAETKVETGINRILLLIPQIFATRKTEVCKILSYLTGKTLEEIENQNGLRTIKEIREAFKEPELVSFFSSSIQSEQNEQ